MGWTTPRTWAVGEVVTASMLNTHVRDNELYLADPDRVRVTRSATQSLTNNTLTNLTWNTETYDTNALHDTATNTDRLVCVVAGLYEFKLNLEFAANATGFRAIYIIHSVGTTAIAADILPLTGAAVAPVMFCAAEYRMAVGEYVVAQGWQNSGGALVVGNTARDYFSGRRVAL